MPHYPHPDDMGPIMLVPPTERLLATPTMVGTIGQKMIDLTSGSQSLPIPAEAVVIDHPHLDFPPHYSDLDAVAGSALAPDRSYHEVVKVMSYNELGAQMLSTAERNLPAKTQADTKLSYSSTDQYNFQALVSVLDNDTLHVTGSCFMEPTKLSGDPDITDFTREWGLESVWNTYLQLDQPGRRGEFSVLAGRLLAGRILRALTALDNLPPR